MCAFIVLLITLYSCMVKSRVKNFIKSSIWCDMTDTAVVRRFLFVLYFYEENQLIFGIDTLVDKIGRIYVNSQVNGRKQTKTLYREKKMSKYIVCHYHHFLSSFPFRIEVGDAVAIHREIASILIICVIYSSYFALIQFDSKSRGRNLLR